MNLNRSTAHHVIQIVIDAAQDRPFGDRWTVMAYIDHSQTFEVDCIVPRTGRLLASLFRNNAPTSSRFVRSERLPKADVHSAAR
ncbi:hypothetical protein D3Y57_12985 [Sphingomonas paeninsulae]|jgi:hypothetical protein|uniref:Uncharacterized protein n=1 Tax=Sphingomonas paeninsulae TaxID=2319844 RepID=A0A494TLK4_SPHPE|nr:hypothetical protein D3Y57_12985 [Sphingomonas paeninsulae]